MAQIIEKGRLQPEALDVQARRGLPEGVTELPATYRAREKLREIGFRNERIRDLEEQKNEFAKVRLEDSRYYHDTMSWFNDTIVQPEKFAYGEKKKIPGDLLVSDEPVKDILTRVHTSGEYDQEEADKFTRRLLQARFGQQKTEFSEQNQQAIDLLQTQIDDLRTPDSIAPIRRIWYASAADLSRIINIGNHAIKGEDYAMAYQQAARTLSAFEPEGNFEKLILGAAGNAWTMGLSLAGFAAGGAVGGATVGNLVGLGAMALPVGNDVSLDLMREGVDPDTARAYGAAAGIGSGLVSVGLHHLAGKVTGTGRGASQRAMYLLGLDKKAAPKDFVDTLYKANAGNRIPLKAVSDAMKKVVMTRKEVFTELGKEASAQIITSGGEEVFQEMLEMGISEFAVKKYGDEGATLLPRYENGDIDYNAVSEQLAFAFALGALLEGVGTSSIGTVMATKSRLDMADKMDLFKSVLTDNGEVWIKRSSDPQTAAQQDRAAAQTTELDKNLGPEDHVKVDLADFGPEIQDYIARSALISAMKAEQDAKGELDPKKRKEAFQEGLTKAVDRVIRNPLEAITVQFADLDIDSVSPDMVVLKLRNGEKIAVTQADRDLEGNNAIFVKGARDSHQARVSPKVWQQLQERGLDKNFINIQLYAGSTLPHEVFHALVEALPETQRNQVLDLSDQQGDRRAQHEDLASQVEQQHRERYDAPVKAKLKDLYAKAQVILRGDQADTEARRRTAAAGTLDALRGKRTGPEAGIPFSRSVDASHTRDGVPSSVPAVQYAQASEDIDISGLVNNEVEASYPGATYNDLPSMDKAKVLNTVIQDIRGYRKETGNLDFAIEEEAKLIAYKRSLVRRGEDEITGGPDFLTQASHSGKPLTAVQYQQLREQYKAMSNEMDRLVQKAAARSGGKITAKDLRKRVDDFVQRGKKLPTPNTWTGQEIVALAEKMKAAYLRGKGAKTIPSSRQRQKKLTQSYNVMRKRAAELIDKAALAYGPEGSPEYKKAQADLREMVRARVEDNARMPVPKNKIGKDLVGTAGQMRDIVQAILRLPSVKTTMWRQAAFERLLVAVKGRDSLAQKWDQKEVSIEIPEGLKGLPDILSNPQNAYIVQNLDASLNGIGMDQLYDAVVEVMQTEGRETQAQTELSELESKQQIVEKTTQADHPDSYQKPLKPPSQRQTGTRSRDVVTQESEAREFADRIDQENVAQARQSSRPKLIPIRGEHKGIKAAPVAGRKKADSYDMWLPLTESGIRNLCDRMGVEYDPELFTFDSDGELVSFGPVPDLSKENIRAMTQMVGPLWAAAYAVRPDLRGDIDTLYKAVAKSQPSNDIGKNMAVQALYAITTQQDAPVRTKVPGIKLRADVPKLAYGEQLIMPWHLVEFFQLAYGLESDNKTGVGFFETAGGSDLQTDAVDLGPETVLDDDPDITVDPETGDETATGPDKATNTNVEISLEMNAEAAARDVINGMAELFAQTYDDDTSMWARFGFTETGNVNVARDRGETAKRVMGLRAAEGSGPIQRFKLGDVLSTLGDLIEAAARRRLGKSDIPSSDRFLSKKDRDQARKVDRIVEVLEKNPLGKESGRSLEGQLGAVLKASQTLSEAVDAIRGNPYAAIESELAWAVSKLMEVDPNGEMVQDVLKRYEQQLRSLGEENPFFLAQKSRTASKATENVQRAKDLLNGIRDMRLFDHMINQVELEEKWNAIFDLPKLDKMRHLARGLIQSFNPARKDTSMLEKADLSQKWSLASVFAVDALNSAAMQEKVLDDEDSSDPEYYLDKMLEAVEGQIARIRAEKGKRTAETAEQLAQYESYAEAIVRARDIVTRNGDIATKVRTFIENNYREANQKLLERYNAASIFNEDTEMQAYWSPYLFLDPDSQEDTESLQFEGVHNQTTGRVLHRDSSSLTIPLRSGRVLSHPNLLSAYDAGAAQVIHAVSNKEFIESMHSQGLFVTVPEPGFSKLNPSGASLVRFQLVAPNGRKSDLFATFKEAKQKAGKRATIEVVYQTLYAPKEIADYFNKVTRQSLIRSSEIGRGLMATNAKLKMARIVWSMFHRRSLLWSAMVAGPVGEGMEFSKADLGHISRIWDKVKHRFDYSARREMGVEAMKSRSADVFGLAYHGMVSFKALDIGETNIRFKSKLDKAMTGQYDNQAHNISRKAVQNISRMTRMFQNELFGRFGTYMKNATAINELRIMRKKNAEKIAKEKEQSRKEGRLSEWGAEFARIHPEMAAQYETDGSLALYDSKTENEIYRKVAGLMNADFGGLHYKRLGLSATSLDGLRLLFLGPDWTASNFQSIAKALWPSKGSKGIGADSFIGSDEMERRMYAAFWLRIAGRVALLTFVGNLLMSTIDDESMFERLRKAWERGGFKWAMVDISPAIHALGGDQRIDHYGSVGGHFFDPLRWAENPFGSFYYKMGTLTQPAVGLLMGEDYANRRPSTLTQIPSEGLRTWKSGNRFGPVRLTETPAAFLDALLGTLPIQIQETLGLVRGQENVITTTVTGVTGADIRRTYSNWGEPRRQIGGGTRLRPGIPYRRSR